VWFRREIPVPAGLALPSSCAAVSQPWLTSDWSTPTSASMATTKAAETPWTAALPSPGSEGSQDSSFRQAILRACVTGPVLSDAAERLHRMAGGAAVARKTASRTTRYGAPRTDSRIRTLARTARADCGQTACTVWCIQSSSPSSSEQIGPLVLAQRSPHRVPRAKGNSTPQLHVQTCIIHKCIVQRAGARSELAVPRRSNVDADV
jgi:hypothetical protein